MESETPILVTTAHKGVFFGYTYDDPADTNKDKITITDARMCVYWEDQLHGVLGLAQSGPNSDCRVSPAVDELTLFDVTAVTKCTDEAAAAWEEEPWG